MDYVVRDPKQARYIKPDGGWGLRGSAVAFRGETAARMEAERCGNWAIAEKMDFGRPIKSKHHACRYFRVRQHTPPPIDYDAILETKADQLMVIKRLHGAMETTKKESICG